MLIKMLSTRMGSERGFGIKQYKEGEYYYVPDSLAASFVRLGYAKFVLGSGGAPFLSQKSKLKAQTALQAIKQRIGT